MQKQVLECLNELDRLLFHSHKKIMDYFLEGTDGAISVPHIAILYAIVQLKKSTSTVLANELGVTQSAITNLTNKLCAIGYLTRCRSKDDRRVISLQLTKEGELFIHKMERNRTRLYADCFANISAEEIKTCCNVIRKVRHNLTKPK